MDYSVGITTFGNRFDRYFVPLLTALKRERPDVPVLVAVNGDRGRAFDANYRRRMLALCAEHGCVFPVLFPQCRGLATLWNTLLRQSPSQFVLLLNDDLVVEPPFWPILESWLERLRCSFKVNDSFSHVVLDKYLVDKVGWFDERMLGIGYEDIDFAWRFEAMFQVLFPAVHEVPGIRRCKDADRSGVGRQVAGYSAFNEAVFTGKHVPMDPARSMWSYRPWKNSREVKPAAGQYPSERFYWEHRDEV